VSLGDNDGPKGAILMKAMLVLLLCLPVPGFAKTKIAVSASCDDWTGQLYAFQLREAIRSSSGYSLEDHSGLNVSVLCLDTAGPNDLEGYSSAISVLVTQNIDYPGSGVVVVYHCVYVVGRNKAASVAAGTLAAIDHELSP